MPASGFSLWMTPTKQGFFDGNKLAKCFFLPLLSNSSIIPSFTVSPCIQATTWCSQSCLSFFFFLSPSYRSFCFLPAMGMEITLTRENSKWTLRNHLVLFHEIMPPSGPEGNPPKAIQSITSPYEWERLPNVCSVSPQLHFKPLMSCPVHSSLFLLSLLHSFTYYRVSSLSSLIQTKHYQTLSKFPHRLYFQVAWLLSPRRSPAHQWTSWKAVANSKFSSLGHTSYFTFKQVCSVSVKHYSKILVLNELYSCYRRTDNNKK